MVSRPGLGIAPEMNTVQFPVQSRCNLASFTPEGAIATSSPQVAIMLQFSVQSKGMNLRHGVFSMDSRPIRGPS
jgi:hypothetical protein